MKTNTIVTIIFSILLISCKKESNNKPLIINVPNLTGSWINPSNIDSSMLFEKSSKLKKNEYGFTFNEKGTFLERKNAGWCATPPVSYADFNGSWILKDSIIEINVDYWGGKATYQWKVVLLENNWLKIINRNTKYSQTTNQ